MSAKKIFCMGNPLLDISADVEADLLTEFDLQPANAILAEDKHLPLYKRLSDMPNVQYIPGGATLNSARVANWMLKDQHPHLVSYTGSIGQDDEYGRILVKKAEDEGVNMPVQRTNEHVTGTCAVLIVGKERSMCANLAAANAFKETHLDDPAIKKGIEEAGIYYSAGFFLTVSATTMERVGKHASENGKIFCTNLSAPFIVQFFASQLNSVMPYVDILFANEVEAHEFGKLNSLGDTLEEIAKKASELPKHTDKKRIVIFTHGSKPTVVCENGAVRTIPVTPIESSKIIDTNGAGDAFVGGFLSQLALGKDISTCVLAGHYSAGVVIQHSGCTYPPKPSFGN